MSELRAKKPDLGCLSICHFDARTRDCIGGAVRVSGPSFEGPQPRLVNGRSRLHSADSSPGSGLRVDPTIIGRRHAKRAFQKCTTLRRGRAPHMVCPRMLMQKVKCGVEQEVNALSCRRARRIALGSRRRLPCGTPGVLNLAGARTSSLPKGQGLPLSLSSSRCPRRMTTLHPFFDTA